MTTADLIDTERGGEVAFDGLLAPVDRRTFLAEYWEQKPLLTRGRHPHAFRALFAIRDIDRYIARHRPHAGKGIDLVTSEGFVADNYMHPDGVANLRLVTDGYLAGSTIVLSGLEETWEPLVRLARSMEVELSHPVTMTVYATPPSSRGVKPHFDTQENFLLQVEGTKTWRVWRPVQELPAVEGSYAPVPRERLGEPVFEGRLEPGDMLYIPRGFVHEGIAGELASLHVTIDVHVRTWEDFLREALAAVASREPRLRRSLPVGFLNEDPAPLDAALRELFAFLHEHVRVGDAIAKHVESLTVKRTPPADGHFAALHAEIGPHTLLIKRGSGATRIFEQNGMAGIQFAGNQVFGPAKIGEALRHVAAHDSLTPASLPDSLNANEKLVLARRLVRAGLLTLAEGAR